MQSVIPALPTGLCVNVHTKRSLRGSWYANTCIGQQTCCALPGKCSFKNAWLAKDPHPKPTKLCCKTCDLSNTGEAALVSHMKAKKHKTAAAAGRTTIPMAEFKNAGVSNTSNEATAV